MRISNMNQDYEPKYYNPFFRFNETQRFMASMLVMFVMSLFTASLFIMITPLRNILDSKAQILQLQAKGYVVIPNMESKILDLNKAVETLTTKSIENRLSKIEKTIKVGEIKIEDIQSLQEIRDDFKVLKTYMFETPEKLIEFRSIQKDYSGLKDDLSKTMEKDKRMT